MLLQKPTLARVILKLQDYDLPATSLLEIAEPLRDEIALSLLRLSKIALTSDYQLALQKMKGRDFRRNCTYSIALPQPC